MKVDEKFDIDEPLWDQSTFLGRWKYFVFIADCRTIFVSEKKLREAKQFCEDYKMGKIPPGTQMSDIIRAKKYRDSAFHPDTGELIHFVARLSSQWPASVLLTTSMLAVQKSTTAMVMCQVVNQMHDAVVNYTYRGSLNGTSNTALRNAFLCAAFSSSLVTILCRRMLSRKGHAYTRCVPFCAVVTGHMVNLPIIRYKEIITGTPLYIRKEKKPFMKSQVAAVKGISECLITRIAMCLPCLLIIPILSHKFMPCFPQRHPWLLTVIESFSCALFCMFTIPSSYAIFPERNSMSSEWLKLYASEYEEFKSHVKERVDKVYYHKGL
ncbi:sideroflexin-2-like [Xylocopa sonorina]|uniref:sideroflexin-2-like n=1 Tax=Xylocopa sonorina TaxID=1818115 RepID=UPI00403ABF20